MKKVKKLIALLLTISMLMGVLVAPASAAGNFTVSISSETADAGGEVKVNVNIENNTDLSALTLRVYYNADALTCSNVSASNSKDGRNDTIWKEHVDYAAENDESATVTASLNKNDTKNISQERKDAGWAMASMGYVSSFEGGMTTESGTIGSLTFKVNGELESCTLPVEVEVVKATNSTNDTINAEEVNGTITVNGVAPTLSSVTLEPAAVTVDGTNAATAQVKAYSAKGTDITGNVAWSVAPNDMGITVDATGKVTVPAKAAAKDYTITATPDGTTALGTAMSKTLSVARAASVLSSVKGDHSDITVDGVNEQNLMVTAYDQYDADITSQQTWSVAAVNPSTNSVEGFSVSDNGTVTVPAKAQAGEYSVGTGSFAYRFTVERTDSVAASIKLDKDADRIPINGALEGGTHDFLLSSTITDQFGDDVTGELYGNTVWAVVPADGNVTIADDGNGIVKVTVNSFLADGAQYTITAINGGQSASFVATIDRIASQAYGLRVETDGTPAADAATIGIPGSKTFTAMVLDQFSNYYDDAELSLTGDAGITLNGSTVEVAETAADNATATLTVSYSGLKSKTITITAKSVEVDWSGIAAKEGITYGDAKSAAFTSLPTTGKATAYIGGEATDVDGIFEIVDADTLLNAGEDQTITVKFTVTTAGDYKGSEFTKNYTLTINPKTIGVEWKTAEGGTTNYSGAYTYSGEIQGVYPVATGTLNGDTVAITAEGNTAENVGVYTAKATGLDNKNYALPEKAEQNWLINRMNVTVNDGDLAVTKVYDGTTSTGTATGALGLTGVIDGDELTVSGTIGAYADKKAAETKTITISNLTLAGADAGNYAIIGGATYSFTKASITKLGVTVDGLSVKDGGKVYDGTTEAVLDIENATIVGKIEGDNLSVTAGTGTYADKNIGVDKVVTIAGLAMGGSDGDNYTFDAASSQKETKGTITAKELTVTDGTAIVTKEYDGTDAAGVLDDAAKLGLTGKVDGDDVSVATATVGAYPKADYGTYEVALTSITLTGADAGNYTVAADATFKTATITKTKPTAAQLTVSIPEGAVYTGEAVKATVEANAEGLGTITVKYQQGEAAATTTAPVNAGTYKVIASMAEGANYAAWDVEVDSFTIAKADRVLTVGEAIVLTPSAKTGNVGAKTETNADNSAKIVYASDSNTVLVNNSGAVSASGNGTATITVTIAATANYNAAEAKTVAVTAIMNPVTGMTTEEGVNAVLDGTKITMSGITNGGVNTPVLAEIGGTTLTTEPADNGFVVKMGDEVIATYTVDTSAVMEMPANTTITETPATEGATVAGITEGAAKELVDAVENIETEEGDTVAVEVKTDVTVETTEGTVTVEVNPTYTVTVNGETVVEDEEIEELVTPITVTVTLPEDTDTTGLVGKTETGEYVPITVDGNNVTWEQSAPGKIELINVADSVTITFNYSDGRTQTVTYTAANLGETLPTDDSQSGFQGWTIGGKNYTTVTEELLAAEDATVTASFSSGGGYRPSKPAEEEEETVWPFVDVPETHYWYETIKWAYENGYMNGKTETTFEPSATITRQQLWMVLARLDGADPANMAEAKAWAVENGISDGTNPGNTLTRQQMVAMLWRYANLRGYDVSVGEDTNILSYNDALTVSEYAIPAMQWACGAGIVNGTTDGNLNPTASATRAQFAAILQRFVQKIVEG